MSRLLKKCFFLSVGLHLMLVAVLVLGAAFLVTQPEKVPPVLSMIAPNELENLINPPAPPQAKPNINQPSATRHHVTPPQPPRPPVKPVIVPPQPVKPQVKPRPKNPNPTKPKKPRPNNTAKKPSDIKVNISNPKNHTNHTNKTRPNPPRPPVKPAINAKDVNSALKGLNNLSAKIKVQVSGSNRAAFTSYAQHVVAVYRRAWQPLIPKSLARARIAEVSVTLSRDGRVLRARITRRTGDAALDKSVQRALDKVRSVGNPFPSGSRDAQRTFILDFTPIIGG